MKGVLKSISSDSEESADQICGIKTNDARGEKVFETEAVGEALFVRKCDHKAAKAEKKVYC